MAMAQLVHWNPWDDDPVARATGVSFNRELAGKIQAPAGCVRVCAWHIDFDERPVCCVDVSTLAEAVAIADGLSDNCAYNVDFASAYDERGEMVHSGRAW